MVGPYTLIAGILGAGLAALAYKQGSYEMAHVTSTVDGKQYLVRNMSDKQRPAH